MKSSLLHKPKAFFDSRIHSRARTRTHSHNQIATLFRRAAFPEGGVIYIRGEPAVEAYFVVSGAVRLRYGTAAAVSAAMGDGDFDGNQDENPPWDAGGGGGKESSKDAVAEREVRLRCIFDGTGLFVRASIKIISTCVVHGGKVGVKERGMNGFLRICVCGHAFTRL